MTDTTDDRIYVRVAVDLPSNPKLIDATPMAKWLYVTGFCISGRNLSNGILRPTVAAAEADVPPEHADELTERGVWHAPGHDCDSCEQPPRGHVVIHDYLLHNRSKEEVESLKSKRSEAGRAGAKSRWSGKASAKASAMANAMGDEETQQNDEDPEQPIASAMASAMANGLANLCDTDSKPIANLWPDTDTAKSSSLNVESNPPGSTAREHEPTDAELARITKLTGGGPVHARKTIEFILDHAPDDVAKPMAYVLAAIRNDPEAYRYRRGNPKSRDQECPDHAGQWADHCAGCAADRHAGDR